MLLSQPKDRVVCTLNLVVVALRFPHEKGGSLAVEGVGGVRVPQQLGQEDLENVDHIEHR